MEHLTLTIACLVVVFISQGVRGHSILTSRLVEIPEPALVDLKTLVEQDIDYRYTESETGVTAIKSKKLKACFVVDYDPYWDPTDDDLQDMMGQQPPKLFQKEEKFEQLTKLAGDVIAHMCGKVKVYWFALLGPPSLPLGPVPINADTQPVPISPGIQPPPFTAEGSVGVLKQKPSNILGPIVNAGRNTDPTSATVGNGGILPTKSGEGDPIEPPLKNPGQGNLNQPPLDNAGKNDSTEPPLANPGNGDLIEPPLVTAGNGDLIEPPLINAGNGDLIEPPLINAGNGDFLEPPLIKPGNSPLLEPPVMNSWNGQLVEPPLINAKNSDLIAPPVINEGIDDLVEPPLINDVGSFPFETPPPLAQLLGLRSVGGEAQSDKAGLERPHQKDGQAPPFLSRSGPIVPVARIAQVNEAPTLAPPDPDFKTPRPRF